MATDQFGGLILDEQKDEFGGVILADRPTKKPSGNWLENVRDFGVRFIDNERAGLAARRERIRQEDFERDNAGLGLTGGTPPPSASSTADLWAPEPITMSGLNWARDVALGGVKGVASTGVKLPLALQGVALDVTGSRKFAENIGIRNREALQGVADFEKWVNSYKSEAGQARDKQFAATRGMSDTLLELGANPGMIVDQVAEALPGTFAIGASAGSAVAQAMPGLVKQAAALGLEGKAAEKFIGAAATKIAMVAAPVSEGAQSALDIAGTAQQHGRTLNQYGLPALAAGVGTGVIGFGSNKLGARFGIGDLETDIALRGTAGAFKSGPGGWAKRIGGEALKEGAVEEGPQSSQEAIAENIAMGRPWDQGLGKAAAVGAVTGAAMGGGHAAVTRGEDMLLPEPAAPPAGPGPAAPTPGIAPVQGPGATAPRDGGNVLAPAREGEITPAEKALLQPVNLTALDRVNEIDGELARVTARQADIAPDKGYGPMFDQERADLAQSHASLSAERGAIAQTWPKATPGAPTRFSTEAGVRINAQYALMDAGDLVTSHDVGLRQNPLYPQELQPRDRSRQASELQVSSIVQKLDPARLGVSADAANGAPIVGADGLVESGNARAIALKRVYQANGQKAVDYKQFIKDNAAQFGVDPASVDGMAQPVLVRVRQTPVNRAEFARQANASTVQRMSPSEQALSDASRLTSLEGLNPDEAGDFATSHDFIRQFMGMLPVTEQNDMVESDGKLSTYGYRRIQNAVMAKAYGDSPTLRRMTESMDDNLRNVSKALLRVAPTIAEARGNVAAGTLHDADIAPHLLQAVEGLSALKERGWTVQNELDQQDLTGPKYSEESAALLTLLSDNIRSPRKIAEFFQRYYDALAAAGNPNQGTMFEAGPPPSRMDLIAAAKGEPNATSTTTNAKRGDDREGAQPAAQSGRQSEDAASRGSGDQGNGAAAAAAGSETRPSPAGAKTSRWVAFPKESGTLGIPRPQMPQIKSESRGALVNFLKARGTASENTEIPPGDLKPTQAEYSPGKVEAYQKATGLGERSVLVSSDGYILDGHHQWLAHGEANAPVKAIKFDAPIRELLAQVEEFPGAQSSRTKAAQEFKDALADLADMATRHLRPGFVMLNEQERAQLLPTLVKLFEAAIKVVGSDLKAAIAHVKAALRAHATLKKFVNRIDDATYREAALQAIDKGEAASGDLFAAAKPAEDKLILADNAPPKDKPVVLVYGGSFNPPHVMHVEIARQAKGLLEDAGYKVQTVVVSPAPQSLMVAKSGEGATSLTERTAMAKKAFAAMEGATVTPAPSLAAAKITGKLKRTQQADWARAKYPDATVVSLTGEDSAPGKPPGFPSVYSGDTGTSHEGYYYLAMGRDEGESGVSSSKVRALIEAGQPVPANMAHPDVVRHFKALTGKSSEIAIDGRLYDVSAADLGMEPKPETLAKGDPLLTDTDKLDEVTFEGEVMSRETMRDMIVSRLFNQLVPVQDRAPIAYIMGGGGASGKGTIKRLLQSTGQIPSSGLLELDPDEIKLEIPEYKQIVEAGDWRAANVVHEESSAIAKRVLAKAISKPQYDLVYDVTLGDPVKAAASLRALKAAGYEINLYGVVVDPVLALARADARARTTGRYVPLDQLLKAHKGFVAGFPGYMALVDRAVLFENSETVPVPIAQRTATGGLEVLAEKAYNQVTERAESIDETGQTIAQAIPGSARVGSAARHISGRHAQGSSREDRGRDREGQGQDLPSENLSRARNADQGQVNADVQPGQGSPEGKGPGPVPGSASQRPTRQLPDGSGQSSLFDGGGPDNAGPAAGPVGQTGSGGVRGENEDGRGAEQRTGDGGPVGVPAGRDIPAKTGRNYEFGPDDLTYEGSWQKKATQNVEAVELLKKLQAANGGEGRQATREEQAVLARFIGWGSSEIANTLFGPKLDRQIEAISSYDLAADYFKERGDRPIGRFDRGYYQAAKVLNAKAGKDQSYHSITRDMLDKARPDPATRRWIDLRTRLQAALTEKELAEASRSTQYAHFTSRAVVQSMWAAMERMGFKGGAILEPGAGIGVFPGLMSPAMATNSIYTGIEFDTITGGILKQLFPDERILVESFVDSRLPKNFYDVAIGNPPFSPSKVLGDPEYAKQALALHDYFFAKSIDRVKPGGLVMYISSRYTMDKLDDKARAYLAERADLVGAIRLPQTAFTKNAGTEVVTDVIFLRKKVPGQTFEHGQAWMKTDQVTTPDGPATINEYFVAHPEMVLGTHALQGSMYKDKEYTVLPLTGNIEDLFAAAVQNLPADIYQAQRGSSAEEAKVREIDWNPTAKKEGNYYVNDAGVLMVREGGVGVRAEKVSLNDAPMVKGFVRVRDALKQAHYDQLNDGDWETSLRALKSAYDKFVKQYGQIQQYTSKVVKTKAVDEDTGETYTDEEVRRTHTLLAKLKDDPDWTLFSALETLNDDTGKITPSAFLSERVLGKPAPATINTPSDALLATLNDIGHVDMAAVAARIGLSEADTIEALGSAVYQNPEGSWEMADEYLSGNVKRKLEHARTAASSDKRYERNIAALEVVQPAALPPSKIGVALGMNWIEGTDYQQFLQETAGVSARVAWNQRTKQWIVEELSGGTTERARTDWGTGRRNATQLLEHALTGRAIRIESTVGLGKDQKTVFDAAATEGANAKLQALRDEFAKWIWRDPVRTDRLVQTYNDRFNTTASRVFDGRHLTLPGASKRWKLFDHVKRGAWRIVQTGNTYLAHAVGSGKTFEMVISAMEQRRLGLVKKPMMVVPNHVLGQFASEWLDLYPTAKLMVADEHNFHMDNRRRFVSRVALSDLDGVVITHSAFKLLDLDPAFKKKMIETQLTYMRAALEEAGGDPDKLRMVSDGKNAKGEDKYRLKGSGSRDPKIKQIERQIENMEQKLLKLTSSVGKDKNVRFDELGVDFLYVDEAHEFRKLSFATNRQVKGLTPVGSDQAFDLWMKSQYLEQKTPGRSLVMASGTPITNTIAELYTVNRFMKNQDLIDRGIEDFDSWAAMFGREATELESNASGRYEPVTRFSDFANVGEMTQMFREFADVLTSDHLAQMLGDQRPRLASGSRKIVVTPETAAYEAWRPELEERFDISKKWKPSKEEPNNPDPIIRIIGDARLAAVDMRFIRPGLPSDPESKLNQMIDGVIAVHNKYADMQYSGKDGKIEPAKGSAQMVFSDIGMGAGVAESRGFNARAWMEKRLRDAGIPMAQVAFMSDFKKSTAKLKLFKDVNAGRVRILVGSSKGMGTGVNAQQRLIAEHHLDSPWYPADLEQREGRILRTGNKNPLVEIYAYAAKGSYDEPMWGMLARKQSFIDKALSGDANVREIEDLDSQSQFKMVAGMVSKDPRVLRLAGLKAEIAKMQRLYEDHEQQRIRFGEEYRRARVELTYATERLPAADLNARKVQDLSGDKFKARVGAEQYTERTAWGKALLGRLQALAATGTRDGQTVGEISGFKIDFAVYPSKDKSVYEPYLIVMLPETYYLTGDHTASPVGVAIRASNAVADLAAAPAKLRERIATARAKMDAYANRLEAPFSMAEMLAGTIAEANALELDLQRTDLDKVGLEDTLYGDMRVGDASGNESDSVESGIVMEPRPTSMAADLEAQEKWLTVEAKARGYTDIEALLEKDYPLFDKLAALWRAKHPAEALRNEAGAAPVDEAAIWSTSDTRARRKAALAILGVGWTAEAGIQGARDMFLRTENGTRAVVMRQRTVDGNFYVGSTRKGGIGSNDSSAKTLAEAAAKANAIFDRSAMMSVAQRRLGYKNDAQPDVFAQQLELFTASLPDESQAGPRVQAVRREAADALRVLRGTDTLLGKALSSGLAARQRVNLVGKVASTPVDLATLAQVYRDPRFETFRVVFTDDAGLVVSQVGMTSRLPGSTAAVVGNDHKAYVTRLVEAAAQEGATRMWMLHNHPSGDSTPSSSDSMLTRMFAINVAKVSPAAADRKRGMKYLNMKFMGHVVIDTNQYSVIDGSGESNLHTKDFGAVEPFAGAGAFAGFKITSPDDVMGLAKRIGVDRNAVTLIALSNQNRVHAVTTLPAAVFADQVNEDPKGWNARIRKVVTRAVLSSTAFHVVAVGRDSELMLRLHGQGMTLDTVTINADGSVVSAAKSFGRGRDLLPQLRRTRLTLDTSPAFAYLREQIRPEYGSQAAAQTKPQFGASDPGQAQTDTPAFKAWFGDSKVVGENGGPLVVYHGSPSGAITEFDTKPINLGPKRGANLGSLGTWFAGATATSSPEDGNDAAAFASKFAKRFGVNGATVYPVYLSIKSPAEFHSYEELQAAVQAGGGASKYRSGLLKAGHDGVVIRYSETDDSSLYRDDWVAFRPEQIKSAIGNRGTFDPNNPHMAAETKPQFGTQPATQTKTAAERAEAIIQDKVGRFAPLNAVTRTLTRLSGVEKVAGAAYRGASFLLDRYTPEQIKAGAMSDYGVPEAVIDQRALLQGRQRVQLRQAGALIEKLATLTRAESRVAYEWMNMDGSDPRAYVSMMHGLPEESVMVLQDVQKLIDKLSREAVALGQLDPQAYERNKFAYLRRSYVKYTDELNPGDKAKRSRAISILGNQYKGRGLSESATMKQVENVAPEWWKRKLVEGKADKGLKAEKFIRLERRAASGAGVVPLPGMTGKAKGRVLEVDYFPAGATLPAKYADWDQAGTYEVRDVKGPNLILWRDFTKDERERMGEIDEARFAIAKTLHGMIHDVEVGRYLEWLAHTQAKKEGEVIPGTVIEASERYRDTFKVGEWVRVPDTKIGGTAVHKYGKLAGRYLPGPIWNDLRQVVNGQFKPLGETYAKILSLWKKSKTALSPAVHMNNVMSNFVMMDWHDIGAGHVSKALRIMLSANKGEGKGLIGGVGNKLGGAGIADREAAQAIMDRYRDSGGDIGSWATNEVARGQLEPLLAELEKELAATNGQSVQAQVGVMAALQHALHGRLMPALDAAKGSKPVQTIATEAGTMMDLYQAEDDVFRLAAWLKAKEDGMPDLQAGKLARTSFMDYHINAPWIQAMRNSAWPFLSYTYRAVPMLLETAGKKPHKLLKLMMLAGTLNALGVLMGGGGDDKERKLLPEEKAGRVWGLVPKMIRMPWNDANSSPVYLDIRRFVPVGDVMDVGAGHSAVPLLPALQPGGPLALFGEVIANRSMFTGKPITLETDTPQQQAVKMAAYLYQAFMPNLLGVPGTYATTGVRDAVKGKTDAFGREQSVAQAVASSIGIKLGSYPADVLLRNERAKAGAQLMEIDKNIVALRRQRQLNKIDQDEFEAGVRVERAKKDQVARTLREKMN